MRDMTHAEAVELEGLVDRVGMGRVLLMLSQIASEKADHIRSNWQDGDTARSYVRASTILDRAKTAVLQRCGDI